ncbi:DUF4396 domain-containing protein [Leifsonia sp. C5G2]|uniref:DUF4396 domain-containing protein n=1 Tax=Leifsonia sp. C5G2 TaxID=2735269 RepID=UPI0015856804|nr:DUF4396 domain-containing protein [Leifsonia sp. C5G2]NUU07276.1 DUF4396 domain-containing protein [Leifsonia sp. C5G2]
MNGNLATFPLWLTVIAALSLAIAVGCALVVTVDVVRRPQRMAVMAIVWPVSMLFGGALWLALYWRTGRGTPRGRHPDDRQKPMRTAVATGTNHCGAGCALGDLIAEWLAFLVPAVAVLGGYGWFFEDKMFAVWVIDFVLAFGIGIVFQYFAIAPMRGLGVKRGIIEALKADAASITAWQVGMFGLMAIIQLLLFPLWFGGRAPVDSPEFWFAMQWAMLAGFATSYPVNWVLVSKGVKERM